jgi:hypothetical protein
MEIGTIGAGDFAQAFAKRALENEIQSIAGCG